MRGSLVGSTLLFFLIMFSVVHAHTTGIQPRSHTHTLVRVCHRGNWMSEYVAVC